MSTQLIPPAPESLQRPDAAEALRRLLAGNARYVRGELIHGDQLEERRSSCATEQHPVAAVLGCSDSRVPPQLVFDQGPGDLFTIRVAGHIAQSAEIASIEYAVRHLEVPLVVVLGHTRCGAVSACLSDIPLDPGSHLETLIAAISPAVLEAKSTDGDTLDSAIRFHIRNVVEQLRTSEPLLAARFRNGEIQIVGALYDLDSGIVSLLV
jgi:carbonic anhydrase